MGSRLISRISPRCGVDIVNVLRMNKLVARSMSNACDPNYGCKPLNVLNPMLIPCHLTPLGNLDEIAHDPLVTQPRVIIIGAGMAGLSAAHRLQLAGLTNYIVLDARERVGGRIYTESLNNRDLDLGCEWILGAGLNNSVYQLAAGEGLCTHPGISTDPCLKFHTSDGRVVDPFISLAATTAFYEIEKCARVVHVALDKNSYGDLQSYFAIRILQFLHNFPEEFQYDAACVMYGLLNKLSNSLGTSLSDIDAKSYGSRNFLSGRKLRIPYGFKRVLMPMLREIPVSNIVLGKVVTKILNSTPDSCGYRVTVCCCDGESMKADYVICTIPIAILKLDGPKLFCPPLPEEKMKALYLVKNAYYSKIIFEYDYPFWTRDHGTFQLAWSGEELNYRDDWVKGVPMFEEAPGCEDVLCCCVGGREARRMEQCNPQDVAQSVTDALRKFLGDMSIPFPKRIMRTNWSGDDYAGASTYYLDSAAKPEHMKQIGAPLCSPESIVPAVYFAGDYCQAESLGTVHAARASGIEVAEKILILTQTYCGRPRCCMPSEPVGPKSTEEACKSSA